MVSVRVWQGCFREAWNEFNSDTLSSQIYKWSVCNSGAITHDVHASVGISAAQAELRKSALLSVHH